MQDKKLSDQEYLAIDSILEDAERKYLPKNSVAFDLESLDQQCRDIWSDWDFSVPTISKSPIDSTKKINIDVSYQSQKYRNEINPSSLSSDDDVNTSNSENIRKVVRNSQFKQNSITKAQNLDESDSDSKDSSEDLSSDSEIIRKPPKSPMRSPLILSGRYSGSKSKNKSRKKSPFKSSINSTTKSLNGKSTSNSKTPIHAYDRADVARLRQDNISLRAMVSRLQDALDRANYENSRLKEELNKSEMNCMRQKGIISYLKEQKLYGKK